MFGTDEIVEVSYLADLESYNLPSLINEVNRMLTINAECGNAEVREYTRHLIDTRLKPAIKNVKQKQKRN